MRKLSPRRFTPRRIAELGPRGGARRGRTSCSTRSPDRWAASSTWCTELLRAPATTVVGTMLGIPPSEHDDARRWTDDLLTREPGNPVPPQPPPGGVMNRGRPRPPASEARRAQPDDDILSLLVEAEVDGAPLTDADR